MIKIFYILLLIFSYGQLFGQDYPSKRELIKLFSEKQEYLGEFTWEACNDDSMYYKNDTIRLIYRNTSCLEVEECCNKIEWAFVDRKSFGIIKTSYCQEPPISSALNLNKKNNIKIIKSDSTLELHITNQENHKDIYEVVSLLKCTGKYYMASGKFGYELVLHRKQK